VSSYVISSSDNGLLVTAVSSSVTVTLYWSSV